MAGGLVGRPALPAKVHVLRGNLSKKPASELVDEFQPDVGLPAPPEWLGAVARAEYERVGTELVRYGIVAEIDRGTLVQMASEWERICWAEQKIATLNAADQNGEAGLVDRTPNNYRVNSVYLNILRGSQEKYTAACNLLGCTPAARVKVRPADGGQLALPGLEAPGAQDAGHTLRSFAA